MPADGEPDELSRRDLAIVLGTLGGTAGVALLGGCAGLPATAATGPPIASTAAGGGDIITVQTVLGAAPPKARTGDLSTRTGPELGASVAIAQGCVSSGDGGGGLFIFDAGSSRRDDGGTVIRPSHLPETSPGRWLRVCSGAFDVKWFGATGDGATPDDVAIQRAIDAAASQDAYKPATAGPGTLFFPQGRYILNRSLSIVEDERTRQSNMVLRGCNGGASGQYARSVLVWNGDDQSPMLRVWSRDNVIEHLCFFVKPGRTCLCAIDDTEVPGGVANTANTYRYLRIGTDALGGVLTYGIKIGDRVAGGGYPANCDNHQFEACYFDLRAPGHGTGVACIYVPNPGGQSKNLRFSHCRFTSAQYALQLQSGSFSMQSCSFWNITTCVIEDHLATDSILIAFSDVEECPRFFRGGGQSVPWPVVFLAGRYDVTDVDVPYSEYISVESGGPLLLLGVRFGCGQSGKDEFSVTCSTSGTEDAGGTLVAIGCTFPNTVASTPFATKPGKQQRVIGLGNHRFSPRHGTYVARLDDVMLQVNSGERPVGAPNAGVAPFSRSDSTATVTFPAPEPDASYGVVCTLEADGPLTSPAVPYVTGKTPSGFVVNLARPPGAPVRVNWMLVRS